MVGLTEHIRKDRGFYAFIFGYAALGALIAAALGQADKFVPLVYYPRWVQGFVLAILLVLGLLAVRALFNPEPMAKLKADLRAISGPEYIAGAALFMALALFHGVFTSVKTTLPNMTSFRWDPLLADLDRALHGQDPWLWLRFLEPVTLPMQIIYGQSWFLLVALSSFMVCVWPRLKEVRSQFVWTFLLCWSVLGNLLAGVFFSGGPVFYERIVGGSRFGGLTDHLQTLSTDPAINAYPQILWTAYTEDRSGFGTGISAFPSMHLSMTTLFVLLAFRMHRVLGYVMLAYLAIIMAGSVHLGWHYAVDGYFAIFATLTIWLAVGWARRAVIVMRPSLAY